MLTLAAKHAQGGPLAQAAAVTAAEPGVPDNPVWSELTESPTGVAHALSYGSSNCVVGGYLYAAKGWDGSSRRNDAHRFDVAARAWETLASDSGGVATRGSSAAMHGATLYVIGGQNNSAARIASVRIYDTATNTWSGGANMPASRADAACAVDDARGDIYICGGRDGSGAYQATVWRYNVAANTWYTTTGGAGAAIPNAPVTAAFGAAFVWGDWLYYFPAYTGAMHATMYRLDLTAASPTWQTAGTHPAPTRGMSSLAYEDRLYMLSGYDGSAYTPAVYRYDAATQTFAALNNMAAGGVSYGWCGYADGRMYAGAGYSGTAYTQDVQEGS